MKQYLKKQEGVSTPLATRYKPSFSKSEYNGFGELYQDGKWYEDVNIDNSNYSYTGLTGRLTSHIYTNGTNTATLIDDPANNEGYMHIVMNLTAGKKYRLSLYLDNGWTRVTAPYYCMIFDLNTSIGIGGITSISGGSYAQTDFVATSNMSLVLYTDYPITATYTWNIIPLNDDGSIDISNATELTTPQTYLPIVANVDEQGNIVDIDSFDVPTLVEKSITAETVNAETKGKNSCTAWVNFDGTTTPPTIRDSYNVSQVIRIATGVFDVYFEEAMDSAYYQTSFTAQRRGDFVSTADGRLSNILGQDTTKVRVRTSWVSSTNGGTTAQEMYSNYLTIFGGKDD